MSIRAIKKRNQFSKLGLCNGHCRVLATSLVFFILLCTPTIVSERQLLHPVLLHMTWPGLAIWGQLHLSTTGQTVGGWLVNSWSELGAPFWQPEMHWFDAGEKKFYRVFLDIEGRSMNLIGEAIDIDAERASFIRKMIQKWEKEWLQRQPKFG